MKSAIGLLALDWRRLAAGTRALRTPSARVGMRIHGLLPGLAPRRGCGLGAQRILALECSAATASRNLFAGDREPSAFAVYPHDGSDARVAGSETHGAMLNAKGLGHNRYGFVRPHMNEQAIERRFLELADAPCSGAAELCALPAADRSYDPSHQSERRRWLRWCRPKRGIALPTDLVGGGAVRAHRKQIRAGALREACRQAPHLVRRRSCSHSHRHQCFRVELRAKGFAESLRVICWETGLPAAVCSNWSITEPALAKDQESIARRCFRYRAGYGRAGGSGSFSAPDFRELDPSPAAAARLRLKIDQSLVRGLCSCDDDGGMVRRHDQAFAKASICGSSAKGVETKEQFLALQNLQCHDGQGRYFCDPLPGDEFAKLLEEQCRTTSNVLRLAQHCELST